ncbi:MAG: hypothetical protein AAF383_15275 [Cyanobacteria bacterium P01_A01_bin.83]
MNSSPEIGVKHQQAISGGLYVQGACTSEGWCIGFQDGEPPYATNAPVEKIDPAIMPYPSGFIAYSDGSTKPL